MTYTVVQKIKGRYYLYEVDGYWDKEKKQARQKRRYIGRCDEEGNLIEAKLSQREVSVSKTFGPAYLFLELAGQTGLYDRLVDAFPDDADSIIALAIMRIICPEELRNIRDHLEESFLPELLAMEQPLSSHFPSHLLSKLGKDRSARQRLFHYLIDEDDVLIYDFTTFKSFLGCNGYPEYGSDHCSTILPQANFGLVHSLDNDLPLCYKMFSGRINDVTTLHDFITELKECGVRGGHFLLDGGVFSESNLAAMMDERLEFTIPVPFSCEIAKTLISETNGNMENPVDTYVFKSSVIRVNDSKIIIAEKKLRAITYLNESRRKDEITALYSRLDMFEKTLNGKRWHSKIHDSVNRYDKPLLKTLDIINDGGIIRTERRRNAIDSAENKCGKMILLTTSNEGWDVVLQQYQQRNDAEKDFRSLERALEGGVQHLSSSDSADAMIFVEFVASVLRSSLSNRAHDAGLLEKSCMIDIMDELAKLKITRIGQVWRLNEVSKTQREMLKALGVNLPVDAY